MTCTPTSLEALLKELTTEILTMDYVHPDDIPNIDLYMDQVTTFMDSRLQATKRSPEDKILTKTMINNYAKNNLLPPPVKKKYAKNHLLLLTFIYYLKSFLSIKDIEMILSPVRQLLSNPDNEALLDRLYREILSVQKDAATDYIRSVRHAEKRAKKMTDTVITPDTQDCDSMAIFSMIAQLSVDIYMKKTLVEKLVDHACSNAANESKK